MMAFASIPVQQLHSLHTTDEKARARLMRNLRFKPGMAQGVSEAQRVLKVGCFKNKFKKK